MKRNYLILLFSIVSLGGYSQSFPRHSAVWFYQYYDDNHLPTNDIRGFYMLGDTVINATNYSKVYDVADNYVGAFRDSNRVVYSLMDVDTIDKILMDCNLMMNDTFVSPFCDSLIIASTDSVNPKFGTIRKQIDAQIFGGGEGISFIEGVGIDGSLSPLGIPCYGGLSGNYILICFEESNLDSYYSNWATICYLSQEEFESPTILIYPNPTSNFIHISGIKDNSKVTIFDSYGRKPNNPSNATIIDVGDLANGMYFIQIEFENRTSSFQRFIKQ